MSFGGFRTWLLSQDPGVLHVFIVQNSSSDKYYSIYDTQAHTLAKLYYRTAAGSSGGVIKKEADGDSSVDVLHVSRRLMGIVAKEALDRNEKVQFWRKKTAAGGKGGAGWVSAYEHVASPGFYSCLEEELGASFKAALAGQSPRDPVMAAIVQNATGLGVCVCHPLNRRLSVYEVAASSADDVELLLVQGGVREVLVDSDCSRNAILIAAIRRTQAALTEVLPRTDTGEEALALRALVEKLHLPQGEDGARAEAFSIVDDTGQPLALVAASLILGHTRDSADSYDLVLGSLSGHLLYDAAAAKALGLFSVKTTREDKSSYSNMQEPAADDDDEQEENSSRFATSTTHSVLGVLSSSLKTSMGKRKLKSWLQQPLCGAKGEKIILQRQSAIGLLCGPQKLACERLRGCLSNCPDIQTIAARFSLGKSAGALSGKKRKLDSAGRSGATGSAENAECRASLQDALQIYLSVVRLQSIVSALVEAQFPQEYMLCDAQNCILQLSRFMALVEEIVDTEPLVGYKSSGSSSPDRHSKFLYWLMRGTQGGDKRVRPGFSPALTRTHENLLALRGSMVEEADACEEIACLGTSTSSGSGSAKKTSKGAKAASRSDQAVFLEHSSVHGAHLRVTKRNSASVLAALRSRGYNVRVLSTQNAGVLFVTTSMEKYWVQYAHQLSIRSQLESSVVRQAMGVACTYQTPLQKLSSILAEVDVLAGLSHVASLNEWTCPVILHSHEDEHADVAEVLGLRHCVVECQIGRNSYIPSDFRMQRQVSGAQRLALLTGPNMGGKSTYIRAIGIVAILTQIGSFVPATVCKLPLFDRILCRVGACDSISRGISTFKAEMVELGDILRKATPSSLVIVDELGRGTSTHDGFGIAAAAVERLCRTTSVTVFATHFHELTLLASGQGPVPGLQDSVINLHVGAMVAGEGSTGTVTMLYEVKPGPCLQSYGIHVARLAKMPEEVVFDASRIAHALDETVLH